MAAAPPPESPKPRPTRAEAIAAQLADDIVAGRLKPGAALDEASLAAQFSVSRTPVREALRQLAPTGLVQAVPRRGCVVAVPDAAQLAEMFVVMAELEAMAAAHCAMAMTPHERRGLERQIASMAGMVRAGDVSAYRAANVAFHHLIYAGAHNGYLTEIATATRRRLAPFRAAQLEAPDRMRKSHEEHVAIVTAIQRGDAAGAAAALRAHIGVTERTWIAMAGSRRPDAA
ncbi:GntR family transcriptional regulator [Falsiroseomonas stagni]|uniref:DNA-binding transcriptional regulator, GntR family n=1 Tax=Falsiroseomonas stagni DSM 19981 TaxID=1123062 RepID=A0A1I4C4J7_9PROT|nr:GntR family transcriptional regulator [Falsiroseomonas stagni]SFK75086.1 DNA-binding transcriptional regulator, GntR family [Falsiroseomonas stagni DSM 19981]